MHPEATPAAKLRKRVFVGFAGTITMGLVLGGWYVSSRILVAARPPTITRLILPLPPSPPEPAPPRPAKPMKVNPRPGETYLQLAAMGPRAMDGYLEELAAQGIFPSIGPGPSETIYRVLMGPYTKRSELEKVQSTLEGQGIRTIVRKY